MKLWRQGQASEDFIDHLGPRGHVVHFVPTFILGHREHFGNSRKSWAQKAGSETIVANPTLQRCLPPLAEGQEGKRLCNEFVRLVSCMVKEAAFTIGLSS